MSRGTGTLGTVRYEAVATLSDVSEAPYFIPFQQPFAGIPGVFGSIATFNGGDPSHLRQRVPANEYFAQIFLVRAAAHRRSQQVFLRKKLLAQEEETCTDAESSHPHLEVVHLIAIDQSSAYIQIETGTATADSNAVSIGFLGTYT